MICPEGPFGLFFDLTAFRFNPEGRKPKVKTTRSKKETREETT
jgi:hypothetical protein